MLIQLQIRNFTIIDSAEIDFAAGMTSLTGETGAGKSILLDAIGLVLGDRADAATVRPGSDRAEITAEFQPQAESQVWQWLTEQDLDDEQHCLLRRIVTANGKSRGYINGRPVTMQTLRTLGEMLVDIHGQHEHYALTQRGTQRELLDAMSHNQALPAQVAQCYQQWQDLLQKIQHLTDDGQQREQHIDMLRFQIQEFDSLQLHSKELDTIEAEHQRYANAGQLLELAEGALQHLQGHATEVESSADFQLNAALKQLERLHGIDASVAEYLEIINTAAILNQEASNSLRDYISRIDLDGEQLRYLDERLANLHRLAKKHQTDIAGLLAVQQQLRDSLSELTGEGHDLDSLQQEADAVLATYMKQAEKLTRQRKKSAKILAESVTSAMQALGMQGGQFNCSVDTNQQQPARYGLDTIRFLVSPNPGMQGGEISKIASGGELSRISLALALVSSGQNKIPTLIFDEVDSGVGGAVAATVGQYLRQLGETAQVLCVTHLPQVAARAHHHLRVSKEISDGVTATVLTQLSGADTVEEIARMLGGAKVTKKSRQHALELLENI